MAPARSVPRSVQQLVNHQMKRWEVETRASMPHPGGAPCIALSRLPGSGSEAIGRQVAEWLDYGFFGIEIVDQIAKQKQISRELVVGLDEQVRNTIQRYVIDSFRSRPFTESDYLRELIQVITTLGERGMAVILGRGSPYVLPPERALRVLVVAPRAAREERYAKRHGLALEDARDRLRQEEALRQDFLSVQFGVDADDPTLYDLVVNTQNLDTESASRIVIEALRRRFPSPI